SLTVFTQWTRRVRVNSAERDWGCRLSKRSCKSIKGASKRPLSWATAQSLRSRFLLHRKFNNAYFFYLTGLNGSLYRSFYALVEVIVSFGSGESFDLLKG